MTDLSKNEPRKPARNNLGLDSSKERSFSGRLAPRGTQKTTRVSQQQKDEVNLFQHIYGRDNFKLFKKSKNSTSYGLVGHSIMNQKTVTFVVTIPFAYPKQPPKLSPSTLPGASESRDGRAKRLLNIINNFNSKASEMTAAGEPLASQFNYLLTQWEKLSLSNYRQQQQTYQDFLLSCTATASK